MFDVLRTEQEDVVVLSLTGQLDALTAGKTKPMLDEILSNSMVKIVYDLKNLTLIDSSGVGVIVSTFKRSRAGGGDMKLAALCSQPMEVFKVLSLDKTIPIFGSVEEAVASFNKKNKKKR